MEKMNVSINKSILVLLFWFTLDITGFSVGDFCVVESPGLLSLDTLWWLIFIVLIFFYKFNEKIGKIFLTIFIGIWIFIQYSSHWHYTFFGVSEKKLISYNNYFSKTYHIIEKSDKILIPDLYHIILHALLILVFVNLLRKKKSL